MLLNFFQVILHVKDMKKLADSNLILIQLYVLWIVWRSKPPCDLIHHIFFSIFCVVYCSIGNFYILALGGQRYI